MSQNLTIVGPNLPNEAKASFHVHAAGCADLKRGWIRSHRGHDTTTASKLDVVEQVYGDILAEDDATAEEYLYDFHFAPCVDLPERKEA